jgi:hypothetical protein
VPITRQRISSHPGAAELRHCGNPYSFKVPDIESKLAHRLLYRMNMSRYIFKSVLFVTFMVVVCGGLCPRSLEEYFEPHLSAASYTPTFSAASPSMIPKAPAVSNDSSHHQNVDSAVAATPSLDRPAQKLCYFYDC